MKTKFTVFIFASLLIAGCSQQNPETPTQLDKIKKENAALLTENEKLKSELDELKYGAEKLLAEAKKYYDNKDLNNLNTTLATIKNKHPESSEIKTISEWSTELTAENNKKIAEEKKKAANAEAAKKKRLAEATSKLRKNYDEVEEVDWYYDKSTVKYINQNGFYLYMGKKANEEPWLRIKIQYAGDDWVFIDSYTFKVDGTSFDILPSYGEIKRDNDIGGVWEYYDGNIYKKQFDLIKSIIKSKKTIIRHKGDTNVYDRTVTEAEKKALQNILDAYEALGGKEPTI